MQLMSNVCDTFGTDQLNAKTFKAQVNGLFLYIGSAGCKLDRQSVLGFECPVKHKVTSGSFTVKILSPQFKTQGMKSQVTESQHTVNSNCKQSQKQLT